MNIYFTTRRSDKKVHRYIENEKKTLCGLEKVGLYLGSPTRTLNMLSCKVCDKKAKAIVPQVQPSKDYPKIIQITGSLSMVYGLDENGDLWRAFNTNEEAHNEADTILSWEMCIPKNKLRRIND